MAITKTTSGGILAIYRPGLETAPKGPLSRPIGRSLAFAGLVSIKTLLRTTYKAHGFEVPEIDDITGNEFPGAEQLIQATIKPTYSVKCAPYSNTRLGELGDMRATLREGYSSILEETRELVEISNPYVETAREAARLAFVGGLYIPESTIRLPDAMVQLGLAQTAK